MPMMQKKVAPWVLLDEFATHEVVTLLVPLWNTFLPRITQLVGFNESMSDWGWLLPLSQCSLPLRPALRSYQAREQNHFHHSRHLQTDSCVFVGGYETRHWCKCMGSLGYIFSVHYNAAVIPSNIWTLICPNATQTTRCRCRWDCYVLELLCLVPAGNFNLCSKVICCFILGLQNPFPLTGNGLHHHAIHHKLRAEGVSDLSTQPRFSSARVQSNLEAVHQVALRQVVRGTVETPDMVDFATGHPQMLASHFLLNLMRCVHCSLSWLSWRGGRPKFCSKVQFDERNTMDLHCHPVTLVVLHPLRFHC